ncbi:MAG: DsbA family protein [Proteobacteria bacterium]|nr:DsbA family protein [Pseudomonadota bacterium]
MLLAPVPTRAQVPDWATTERTLGKADAPVVMIEYFSLTCPHCADFHAQTLPTIKEKYVSTGKVRLILRDFPLDGVALMAAMLARCVPPERYSGFVDVLFRSMNQWARDRDPRAGLMRIGRLGGVDEKTAEACLGSEALQRHVVQSRIEASSRYRIESTPSFVINGRTVAGALPIEEFERLLGPLVKTP